MKHSIVKKGTFNEEFRIDAEFYSPDHLTNEDSVTKHNYRLLGDICELVAGPFGSTVTIERYDATTDKRYIRGKDIQSFFLEKSDAVFLDDALFQELPQFHLRAEDILLTVVGMKFGKSTIIYSEDCPAVFSCKSTLIRNPSINVWYLLAYISSNIGYGLVRRGQRGAAQPGINLFDIQNIPVPIFSDNFQSRIEILIKQAKLLGTASDTTFSDAQTILLSELGFTDWHPEHHLTFIKNHSEVRRAERFIELDDAMIVGIGHDKVAVVVRCQGGGVVELRLAVSSPQAANRIYQGYIRFTHQDSSMWRRCCPHP